MGKKSWIGLGLLVVLLGAIYVGLPNAGDKLIHDMVELDRNYIPALAMTTQGKLQASQKAMAKLMPAWQDFMKEHQDMERHDADWNRDVSKISEHINAANELVKSGTNLNEAHEELEQVRMVLMAARERNHIDYFIDTLVRFHEPMETLVLSVKGKKPVELEDATIVSMRSELKTAEYLWEQVINSPFKKDIFGFSQQQANALANLKQMESEALSSLEQALAGGDKATIIKAGMAIKPPFAKMYMMFGAL